MTIQNLPVVVAVLLAMCPLCVGDIEAPLIGAWAFDEPVGPKCSDHSGHALNAQFDIGSAQRVAGVWGAALKLSGQHRLAIDLGPQWNLPAGISLSAWARPTELSNNRELFRKEDGEQRVLFSFQNNGRILSLGLNINGYVECDAPIDSQRVLDERWHHCAATFDGQMMRVFLDGREVGRLERPGRITAGGPAPGCIGSSNGGECFQGTLDDLRIYAAPLTESQIAQLYIDGMTVASARGATIKQQLAKIDIQGNSLALSLADARRKIAEMGEPVLMEVAEAIDVQLTSNYREQSQRFREYTGATLAEYLAARDDAFHRDHIGRLIEMMTEYRPLTEHQRRGQTPDQRDHWKRVDSIERKYRDLLAEGEASADSPRWIELVFEAGAQVVFRPVQHEAVAAYQTPQTPDTRTLSADEAERVLQRDWLFQIDGSPQSKRIAQEIAWTRQLAARIAADYPDRIDFSQSLAELNALADQSATMVGPDESVYFAVRKIKRQIMLANPAVDFSRVVMVDMPYPAGKEWPHETRHRLGYMAVSGARLLVLDGLNPGGTVRQLMPQAPLHGSFWRPDVSYDGQRIVFCFKPHNEKSFHLYEIGADGRGLRQLTDGPYDDLDPIYLPDGHLMFSTTRGHTYVRCMPPTNSFVLARCEADGRNIYIVSVNNEPDYLPSMLDDGRVIYTRWEYTDKPLWRAQGLWTVNPDGTQVNTFWGNQSVWPDLIKDARQIPGSHRVMFTGSAHHNWFSGSVGIIDPAYGYNFPEGLTKVTADVAWPESGNGPIDPVESPRYHASGRYGAYYSPYPLSEHDFLVSANREGKFALYLMDVDGNRELIYEGVHNIFHAMPLKARPRPQALVDRVAWPDVPHRETPEPGVIYSADVYQDAPPILRGKAKYLRVLQIEPKTYTHWYKRPYLSTGPVVSAVQSEGVKRVLGTVPIETDGSVAFYAPPGKALHFQLLDDRYRALQTMRSFTGVMPGERRGCTGCHESHSRSPQYDRVPIAVQREPSRITPPPWGDESIGYDRFVQPVLDTYCGSCHQGDGEARKALDLTERPGFLMFTEPYLTLIGRPTWGQAYSKPQNPPPGFGIAGMIMVEGYDKTDPAGYQTPEPMTQLSYRSRLIDLASSGEHYDVKVDAENLRRLIAWVDAMCPFRGHEEIRKMDDPQFQGVDWLAIRPRVGSAPTIQRPGPLDDQ